MKKSLKVGLFLAGFLMVSAGCSVSYCTSDDLTSIKNMYELKTSIYVVDQVINEVNKTKGENEKVTVETENLFEDYIANETYYNQVNSNIGNNGSEKIKGYLNSTGMNEKVENQYYIKLHGLMTTPDTNKTNSIKDQTIVLNTYYPNAKKGLDTLINDKTLPNSSTCLTTDENVKEPLSGATIEPKTWKFAWQKGPLQGLITYPISAGLIFFTNLIGASGVGQILSILFVTIIVRLIITLFTFKTTMQQQKMTLVQSEMSAIQVKYQGKTDQASKQKMSQEMMKLYQKYDIHPFKSLLMPFISMPVFLCVYHAVNNTSILKTGTVFGVNLGDSMSTGIFGGKIFAIILFLLMVAFQYASMKLPQWIQKWKQIKSGRRPDPRIAQTQKQTNTMTTVFFVMIVVMGFMLPTSMTVYWIASSLVSIAQTLITQKIMGKMTKKDLQVKKK